MERKFFTFKNGRMAPVEEINSLSRKRGPNILIIFWTGIRIPEHIIYGSDAAGLEEDFEKFKVGKIDIHNEKILVPENVQDIKILRSNMISIVYCSKQTEDYSYGHYEKQMDTDIYNFKNRIYYSEPKKGLAIRQ